MFINSMKIDETIDYIREMINFKIELDEDKFIEIKKGRKGNVYAIDGSSAKLFDAYSFSIFARRVGYIFANEKGILNKEVGDIVIDLIHAENAEEENERRREKEEYEIVKECLTFKNGIVLFDGCLKNMELKDDMVVGISKKSGLKYGNIPLLFLIKKYGDELLPNKCWYYKIDENVYVVKLHPYSRFAFRLDYYGNDIEHILSILLNFCNDISYLGYPYPLAEIHKMVKIEKEEIEYLKHSLQEKAIEKGIKLNEWESLFYDYHEYIEG